MPENQASVSDQIAEGPRTPAELPESRYEAALQLWWEWFAGGGRAVPPIPDDTSLMLQWIVGRFRAATRETRGTPHDQMLGEALGTVKTMQYTLEEIYHKCRDYADAPTLSSATALSIVRQVQELAWRELSPDSCPECCRLGIYEKTIPDQKLCGACSGTGKRARVSQPVAPPPPPPRETEIFWNVGCAWWECPNCAWTDDNEVLGQEHECQNLTPYNSLREATASEPSGTQLGADRLQARDTHNLLHGGKVSQDNDDSTVGETMAVGQSGSAPKVSSSAAPAGTQPAQEGK